MLYTKVYENVYWKSCCYGKIYKLIFYDLIIPSAKGYLYDTTIVNYDIFISSVPYCGNNHR